LGEIIPDATEKGAKYQPFFVMNITHPFRHFRFTDFRETWQEILNFSVNEYSFTPKTDFSV